MKILWIIAITALFSFPAAFAQTAGNSAASALTTGAAKPEATNLTKNQQNTSPDPVAGGCANCAASAALNSEKAGTTRAIPGTTEEFPVGSVENLIPIGVLTVLGCEKCASEAVTWALQQGSSFEDVERTLRTVSAMRHLDCFKGQFGPEVASRMEKPLAAAQNTLQLAKATARK